MYAAVQTSQSSSNVIFNRQLTTRGFKPRLTHSISLQDIQDSVLQSDDSVENLDAVGTTVNAKRVALNIKHKIMSY
jgi:hypothetical protein